MLIHTKAAYSHKPLTVNVRAKVVTPEVIRNADAHVQVTGGMKGGINLRLLCTYVETVGQR